MKMNISIVVTLGMLLLTLPAAASDYTLGIFGNANEDETINMQDVTYTELIILEYRDKTELADGKYDNKINMQDVTQIELIILGKEKELTFEDFYGDAVTVNKPVKRIIPEHITSLAVLWVLGAEDRIIALDTWAKQIAGQPLLQDLTDLPSIGNFKNPDYEAILSLDPDVYLPYNALRTPGGKETLEDKLPGITVLWLGYYSTYNQENFTKDVLKLGYILDRRDEAEEYIDWYDGYMDIIKERIAGLSEDEKPRVYEFFSDPHRCVVKKSPIDPVGGINIGDSLTTPYYTATAEIDPEWLIEQNPDIIFSSSIFGVSSDDWGYDVDDPSIIIAKREELMDLPGWEGITAVQEGRVYFMHSYSMTLFPNYIISSAYMAKWFHPNLFEDLDPEAIHQEYLTKFWRVDYDLNEHGIFLYPPIKIDGGLAGIPDRYEE